MNINYDILIVGGGAAGFFTAINCAQKNPNLKIAILERGKEVLSKVRISGGGRCNVTHACYIPNELVKNYPRGEKELKGPFNQFCAGDTQAWFEAYGVTLKTEADGRMFPASNTSQTIIDCFTTTAAKLGIVVLLGESMQSVYKAPTYWKVQTNQQTYACNHLILTTGSNPKVWEILKNLGHTIIPPVPSLFTFNCKDSRIINLMGLSANVSVKVQNTSLNTSGPLLITHWGMSGPAVLRLSAWGAIDLAAKNYRFSITINWLNDINTSDCMAYLQEQKQENAKKLIATFCPFAIPKRLWENLLLAAKIPVQMQWANCTKTQINELALQLTEGKFEINGKSTFKEEFVTAGGVHLKEIDFKTMQSKLLPNVYFAGEIVNIDAITGGFNFQNAWTTGYIVANSIV